MEKALKSVRIEVKANHDVAEAWLLASIAEIKAFVAVVEVKLEKVQETVDVRLLNIES
jgi:hypothetical protein